MVEVLSQLIKSRQDIKGIEIKGEELKILQFADDTTILLKDKGQINRVLGLLKFFRKISGLGVNIEKSEAYALGTEKIPEHGQPSFGLKWSNGAIFLLGLHITDDEDQNYLLNFAGRIGKIKLLSNIWLQRNLSLRGKVVVINSLLLSQLVYPSTILDIPEKAVTEAEEILSNFLWNGGNPKVRKDVICQEIEKGGIKMPNIRDKIAAWRTIWIKSLSKMKYSTGVWKEILCDYLPPYVNFDILLCGKVERDNEVIMRLPTFYKSILLHWSDWKSCNACENYSDIINEPVWYNKFITIERKSFFWREWYQKGVKQIGDLLKDGNRFMTNEDLRETYNINTTFLQALQVKQAIPALWRNKIYNSNFVVNMTDISKNVRVRGLWKPNNKVKSSMVYWQMLKSPGDIISEQKWLQDFSLQNIIFSDFYKLSYEITTYTSVQSFQFKLLHRIINTNRWLYLRGIKETEICDFCDNTDTIVHFFVTCKISVDFWESVLNWWNRLPNIPHFYSIYIDQIMMGIIGNHDVIRALNFVLLYGKFFLYKCKKKSERPFLPQFLLFLRHHIYALTYKNPDKFAFLEPINESLML
jgi:hypothetical protein